MNSRRYSSSVRIGVLGGGQLGKMLLQEAANLDLPGQRVYVHYNSDFPGGLEDREFHPVLAAETTGTGTWKTCEVVLPRALFQGRQNEEADYRLIGKSSGIVVRNIRVRKIKPADDSNR